MKPKIVLLEDDYDLRYIYAEVLAIAGYETVCFETIADFRKGVQGLDANLFLCDVYLPDGNGVDVCNELKAAANNKSIPVVMMSAYTNNSDIVRKCSPDAVLSKPFGLGYLTDVVQSLVD